MPDIHIKRGARQGYHIVCGGSVKGARWIRRNMLKSTGIAGPEWTVQTEFVQELADTMKEQDLIVDID